MKRRFLAWIVCGVILASLLGCLVLYLSATDRPKSAPGPLDLLIHESDIPAGWTESERHVTSEAEIKQLQSRGYDDEGLAYVEFAKAANCNSARFQVSHFVSSYGTKLGARMDFERTIRRPIYPYPRVTLPDLDFRSVIADRFKIICETMEPDPRFGQDRSWTRCQVFAQYDEFTSSVYAPIGPECGITGQDLERMLRAIDQRMEDQVKEPRRRQ